jgi:type I restriction enzyme R subunit
MNREDLAEKFKSSDDPLRLVFVCAMWMTGFDAPSVSTIYLDRPMQTTPSCRQSPALTGSFPTKTTG